MYINKFQGVGTIFIYRGVPSVLISGNWNIVHSERCPIGYDFIVRKGYNIQRMLVTI